MNKKFYITTPIFYVTAFSAASEPRAVILSSAKDPKGHDRNEQNG